MSVENIEKFFAKIDADNSGSITIEEMTNLFKQFDKDGSGKLDKAEFAAGFGAALGGTEEQAAKAFKGLDKDGSGDIEISEVAELFKGMDKDGKIMVTSMGLSMMGGGSGDVSKDEFVAFWVALLK